MNILFITLHDIQDIDSKGIYEDLLREFVRNQHQVSVVSPTERRNAKKTYMIHKKNCQILKVKTGNIQKTNFIEKGISTVLLESQFLCAVRQYFKTVKFDLVLYSTPPITVVKSVELIKKRDGAKTYLLLKDIFPQNAVDIGLMSKHGLKGVLYRYFRFKEKKLYVISDYIGCMSNANVDYVLRHNQQVKKDKIELCPNSIEPRDMSMTDENKNILRKKYGIPLDKIVFVYGGNLGKPQGIPFLIECLRSQKENKSIYFLIIGSGTDYEKLEEYLSMETPTNVKLMKSLLKEDYDSMIGSCDIGMIFLDYRFTIPNFPSRLLSYMQAKLPVLAVTDPNTDIGQVIISNGFGWWCESNDVMTFDKICSECVQDDLSNKKMNSYKTLLENYDVKRCYEIITNHI